MLIDSHCHLPLNAQEGKAILQRARDNDVIKVINIGTSIKENEKSIKIANIEEMVYTTIGIYPHEEMDKTTSELHEILKTQLLQSNKIVGIGECGVDVTDWPEGRKIADQLELFEMQIQLALSNSLPIVIHNRNGDEEVVRMIQKYTSQGLTGVAHCFNGSWELAKRFLDLNFYISFSGFITHNSKSHLLETVQNVPLDKFLVETDSPYIVPKGLNEKHNEPKNVKMIAQKVATIRNLPFEEVCAYSYVNACNLFKINE